MFLWTMFKAIGGFFKKVFTGKTGEFAKEWGETIAKVIGYLIFAKNLSGSQKMESVIEIVKTLAARQGKEYVSHATRLLIELDLAEKMGDDIEAIIDAGLEEARAVVESIDATALVSDDERRKEAVIELKDRMIEAGYLWIADTLRHLNLLIELAVAERKK